MDSKGRLSIPASYRRVLEAGDPDWEEGKNPTMVVVYGDHRREFLECYTIDAIEDIEDLIDNMEFGSDEQERMRRLYTGMSTYVTLDDTGRMVLPQKLRDKLAVSLGSEIFVMGLGQHFEMWNPDTYQEKEAGLQEQWLESKAERFNPKALLNEARRKRDARGE